MTACKFGRLKYVRLLLEKGADIHAKDNKGRTALIYADEAGHLECVQLLLEKGAK